VSAAPARLQSESRADLAGATVGVLPSVRAAVVGLSASGLALLGHVAAGGAAPPAGQLTLAVLAVLVVSRALSVRRWTVGPLLAVLLGSQALFHVAFSGAGTAMHVHGGQHMASGSSMPAHSGLPMLVGHSVAVLVTALLLRRGEDWLCSLVALLARAWRVVRVAAEGPVAGARARAMSRSGDLPALLQLLEHAVARRGPPGLATA
jgi:hypothetical protein